MGNHLGQSQVSYDEIRIKSRVSLSFQKQLGLILNRLVKDTPYLQELKYIANDKYNLVLSAYDQKLQQKIGICISYWVISNIEQQIQNTSKSLIFQAKIIQTGKLFEMKKMDDYLVYFLNYDWYIQFLKEQCNQQKTANIKYLTENHHLITDLHYQFDGHYQIIGKQINRISNFRSYSFLNEEECIFFGTQISKCLFLKQLSLIIPNNFIQKGCFYIGNQLSQCIYLEKIDINIQNNNLSSQDVQPLFLSLPQFIYLKELSLNVSFNFIDKAVNNDLSENLVKCQKIEKLSLILQRTIFNLEKLVSNFSKLELLSSLGLNLNQNQICELNILSLFSEISKCNYLSQLNLSLSQSEINKQTALSFSQTLQQLNKISLDFKDTKLNDEGLASLVQGINLNTIQDFQINLNQNKITSKGFKHFGEKICKCQQIKVLGIKCQNKYIGEQGIIYFMKGLKSLKNLQRLSCVLNNNNAKSHIMISKSCSYIFKIKKLVFFSVLF